MQTFFLGNPARFAIAIFSGLILLFTALFSVPWATTSGKSAPLLDAFFTAVSVICVTGLSTVDMATYWSPFGHALVFIGVQVGAVGVLTMASILGLVIAGKLGLRQKLIAAGDASPARLHRGPDSEGQAVRLSETRGLLATVAISMLAIEAVIAVVLFPRLLAAGHDVGQAAWESIYFSAMAFTNTGFAPTSEGIEPFATDPYFLIAIMIAVFAGAIGFPVIFALSRMPLTPRKWPLHVKLTLVTFGAFFVLGTIAYLVLEWDDQSPFGAMDPGQRLLQAAFLSAMSRSGGFSTVPIESLDSSTLFVTDLLMFVGGGSASTAGGIKVTTVAILVLAAIAEARGRTDMEAFERRIPSDVLRLAVSVALWGVATVGTATVVLLAMTRAPLDHVLFDVISAFATTGLTTGFTASANEPSQLIIAFTMIMGRIGTVTIAAALAASVHHQLFRRPEERPIVG